MSTVSASLSSTAKTWWSAYLCIAVLGCFIWLATYALADPPELAIGVIGFGVLLVGLLPVLGYARQHAYKPRWLWQTYFYLGILLAAVELVGMVVELRSGLDLAVAMQVLAELACMLLYLTALQRYLNASPHLWGA